MFCEQFGYITFAIMKISVIPTGNCLGKNPLIFRFFPESYSRFLIKLILLFFPKWFSTGFSMNPEVLGESPFGETFLWMKKTAEMETSESAEAILSKKHEFL